MLVSTAFRRSLATQAETKIKALLKARFPNAVTIEVTDVSGEFPIFVSEIVSSRWMRGDVSDICKVERVLRHVSSSSASVCEGG